MVNHHRRKIGPPRRRRSLAALAGFVHYFDLANPADERNPEAPPFDAGLIGFIGYDLAPRLDACHADCIATLGCPISAWHSTTRHLSAITATGRFTFTRATWTERSPSAGSSMQPLARGVRAWRAEGKCRGRGPGACVPAGQLVRSRCLCGDRRVACSITSRPATSSRSTSRSASSPGASRSARPLPPARDRQPGPVRGFLPGTTWPSSGPAPNCSTRPGATGSSPGRSRGRGRGARLARRTPGSPPSSPPRPRTAPS